MNRFGENRKRQWGPALSAGTFLLIFLLFWAAISVLDRDTGERQKQALETALQRGLLSCYAMDGRYPETLEDLRSRCPLSYNEQRFYVDYQYLGGNILPDVTVLERGENP